MEEEEHRCLLYVQIKDIYLFNPIHYLQYVFITYSFSVVILIIMKLLVLK